MEMCSLPGAINLPIQHFEERNINEGGRDRLATILASQSGDGPVLVICRRGNDSQLAVSLLRRRFPHVAARDVIGGLHAWARLVDPSFPVY
jgi:adenylyltransferase/sulfurtransferase